MIPFAIMGAMAGMQILGGIMSSQQQRAAGRLSAQAGHYQNALAKRQAQALEQRALQQSAAGQFEALTERRQGNLVAGRSRALAAASGFASNSPSIVQHLSQIGMDTDTNVSLARAKGEQRAADSRYAAQQALNSGAMAEWSGDSAQNTANSAANSSILSGFLSGAGTLASAFGSSPTKATPVAPMSATTSAGTTLNMNWNAGGPLFNRYGNGGALGYA